MYNLQGNDDCIVSFTREELMWCEYPRSVFIEHECELEAEGDIVMPVPYLSGNDLIVLREFLRIRMGLGGGITVRDIPPKFFNSNIMNKDGKTPTGYKLVICEPLVTVNNMPLWMPDYNGIANEFHIWLAGIKEDELFYWFEAADYLGCKDLVYLLQMYSAYLYVHIVEKYMKGVGEGKVAGFREWVREERDDNRREHRFMKGFDALCETHPIMCEQIMTRFVRHRGIRLPRVEWTDTDWEEFYRDAPKFYTMLSNMGYTWT